MSDRNLRALERLVLGGDLSSLEGLEAAERRGAVSVVLDEKKREARSGLLRELLRLGCPSCGGRHASEAEVRLRIAGCAQIPASGLNWLDPLPEECVRRGTAPSPGDARRTTDTHRGWVYSWCVGSGTFEWLLLRPLDDFPTDAEWALLRPDDPVTTDFASASNQRSGS